MSTTAADPPRRDGADVLGVPSVGTARGSASLPVTGHEGIDAALASLHLGPDVNVHHDELAAALDAVQQALNLASRSPLPRR
ncbi:MAG: hypothetical protein ACLGHZ_05295 [Actinomycetes bacterium]